MKYLIYKILILIAFTFFSSCTQKVTESDLSNLNGYWEIEKVTTNNQTKEYKINTTVDYYFLDEKNHGYKLKLKPNFTGNYDTNTVKDTIQVIHKDNTVVIETVTPYNKWEEIILELNENTLILKNDAGIVYQYKKHIHSAHHTRVWILF